MARFLTTIPSNLGFFNLGVVESYPTGGGGPTAYGPTSYFGSDPLPAEQGDNLNNPIDLGDFSALFKTQVISNTHGGLTRKQSTFYQLHLTRPRTVQFTQEFSRFSYEENTNRNTLLAFYEIDENNHSKGPDKINEKKKKKTTKVLKKKKIIQTKKKKESLNDSSTDDNETNKDNKIDIQKDVDLREGEVNEDEEKTGWWS